MTPSTHSTSPTTVTMLHQSTLQAPHPTDVLISADVGPAGDVLALWAPSDDAPLLGWHNRRHGTEPAVPILDQPLLVRLTRHQPNGQVRELGPLRINVRLPHLQPLPGDRYLVVGSRSRYNKGKPDRNATIYAANGRPLLTSTVGDGVHDVQATNSGRVYVSYNDEGTYGSNGWGWPDPPLGASGLVQFDDQLRPRWQFGASDPSLPRMDDCYALNVAGTEVWTCYYENFPITRIRYGSTTTWRNNVTGAHALITDGRRGALIGGYTLPDRVSIGHLYPGSFHVDRTVSLTLGEDPVPQTYLHQTGRGDTLHFISTQGEWWTLKLSQLPDLLTEKNFWGTNTDDGVAT